MQTIYLNMRTPYGVETVDEFTQAKNQAYRDFKKYVRQMIREYHLCNMNVYQSQRCTKDWLK